MREHDVTVYPSKSQLPKEEQLAGELAAVAYDWVAADADVVEMVINRVIDNTSVAMAAINRHAVISARDMALGHPRSSGATVWFSCPSRRCETLPRWDIARQREL